MRRCRRQTTPGAVLAALFRVLPSIRRCADWMPAKIAHQHGDTATLTLGNHGYAVGELLAVAGGKRPMLFRLAFIREARNRTQRTLVAALEILHIVPMRHIVQDGAPIEMPTASLALHGINPFSRDRRMPSSLRAPRCRPQRSVLSKPHYRPIPFESGAGCHRMAKGYGKSVARPLQSWFPVTRRCLDKAHHRSPI